MAISLATSHSWDLPVPEGVTVLADPTEVVVSVVPTRMAAELEAEEEEVVEVEELAEVEVEAEVDEEAEAEA